MGVCNRDNAPSVAQFCLEFGANVSLLGATAKQIVTESGIILFRHLGYSKRVKASWRTPVPANFDQRLLCCVRKSRRVSGVASRRASHADSCLAAILRSRILDRFSVVVLDVGLTCGDCSSDANSLWDGNKEFRREWIGWAIHDGLEVVMRNSRSLKLTESAFTHHPIPVMSRSRRNANFVLFGYS